MSDPVAAIAASMAVDPSSQGAAVVQTAAMPSQGQPSVVPAHDARAFAAFMSGTPTPASHAGASTLTDSARSVAAQFGDNLRSFEDMRHSMLQSVDLRDPIKTMFAMTDHAIEANMMFTKLHLSTSLASSATSLFGTLLKNQQ